MRMRKKKWAEPELTACPWRVPDPDAHRGHWRALFPREAPLHVELGCGKGVSTAEMAYAGRDVNYVAIDLISDVLACCRRNVSRRFGDEPVDNILLCNKDITRIGETFSADDRVQRLYISFPNPWDQRKRHEKRRLTHPRQLMQYRDFLADGAEIWFKTDNDALFDDAVRDMTACGFTIRYLTRDLGRSGFEPNYKSEHELMFEARGVKIKFLIARKDALPAPVKKSRPAPELTTLCYIRHEGKYLMLYRGQRSDDVNAGKWIGVGGHFEAGESPEECLLREVREETGLTLTRWRFRGVVTFWAGHLPAEYMCLYTADAFTGELTECDEGELRWIDGDRLHELPMWEGDRLFFDLIARDAPFFSLKLRYQGDELVGATLDGAPMDLAARGTP